jgi:hypothetical protein
MEFNFTTDPFPGDAPIRTGRALLYLSGLAGGALLCLLAIQILFFSAEDVYWRASSQRIHEWVETKKRIALETPSPKILLLGGSNVFYGINAEQLGKEVGLPVVNVGLHGGLPTEYLFLELEEIVQPGDTVLYAPEYTHYIISPRMTNTETISYLLANAQPYLQNLPRNEYLHVLMTAPAEDLLARWLRSRSRREAEVVAVKKEHEEIISPFGDYRKNRTEDLGPRERRLRDAVCAGHVAGFRSDAAFPDPALQEFLSSLFAFRDRLQERDVKLLFTWPNTIDFPVYHRPGPTGYLDRLQELLESERIPVVGEPETSMLPREDFFDSPYHLNADGAAKRTRRLAEDLKAKLGATAP